MKKKNEGDKEIKRKKSKQRVEYVEEEYEEEVEEEETLIHQDFIEEQNEVQENKRIKRTIETSIEIKITKGKQRNSTISNNELEMPDKAPKET